MVPMWRNSIRWFCMPILDVMLDFFTNYIIYDIKSTQFTPVELRPSNLILRLEYKHWGFSPPANYIDRTTAACR
jgi:hypothetical protein